MAFSDVVSATALAAVMGPGGVNLSFRLFKSNQVVDDDMDVATLTESDFDGYERLMPAWSAPAGDGDGSARTYSDPARWVKGSDPTKAQVAYSWALMLGGGAPAPSTLAVRMLPGPAPMNKTGKSLEITAAIAASLTADPPAGLLLGVEAEYVFRGRRLPRSMRQRWQGLRHALRLLWAADAREDQHYEETGTRKGTYHNNADVIAAAYVLRLRCDQLLGRVVSPSRLDSALKQEILGVLQEKL